MLAHFSTLLSFLETVDLLCLNNTKFATLLFATSYKGGRRKSEEVVVVKTEEGKQEGYLARKEIVSYEIPRLALNTFLGESILFL